MEFSTTGAFVNYSINTSNESHCDHRYQGENLNIIGLLVVVIFYLAVFLAGVVASCVHRKKMKTKTSSEDHILAGRNIGIYVGIFTMTATWVGGGYINGTAECVFTPGHRYGLIWTQAPWAYSLSLIIGGFLFAKKMNMEKYVTMLDPFELKLGRVIAGLCYIPALLGEVFWTAAISSALRATLTVVIGINRSIALVIATVISTAYTLIGGLYSVAVTDVIQLLCILIGLWLAIPFAMLNDVVGDISLAAGDGNHGWLGTLDSKWIFNYIDHALMLMFGGIPWQGYFQRVLSQNSARNAEILSYVAGACCFIMAVPSILIGAIAKNTDWNATSYTELGCIPIQPEDYKLVLPLVLHYLTPTPVALIGLGAVSAAVMSSIDSSVLSASSMFVNNIYIPLNKTVRKCSSKIREAPYDIEVMRITIVVISLAAMFVSIYVESVYHLWIVCADLIYVILFPQLLLVIYMDSVNSYGALAGFVVGILCRLTGGERLLGLPPLIQYPYYDKKSGQHLMPFKTMCMLVTMTVIAGVSYITKILFVHCNLSRKIDFFQCYSTSPVQLTMFSKEGVTCEDCIRGSHGTNDVSNVKDNKTVSVKVIFTKLNLVRKLGRIK